MSCPPPIPPAAPSGLLALVRTPSRSLPSGCYGRPVATCPLGCGPLVPGAERLRDNRFGLAEEIHVAWCPACGLGVTQDPPSRERLDELYAQCYTADSGEPQVPATSTAARTWHRVNGSL